MPTTQPIEWIKALWPILTFAIVQAVLIIWWAAGQSALTRHLERRIEDLTVEMKLLNSARTLIDGRVIRVEEQIRQVYDGVQRIERKLDRHDNRDDKPDAP